MKGKMLDFLAGFLLLLIALWVLLWLTPLALMEDDANAKSPVLGEVRGETH